MTPKQKDAIVAEVRRQLLEYLDTDEFAVRAARACIEIERGGLKTDVALADALGVPVQALTVALERQKQKLIAENGGLN
jgi:hypothetical protein